MYECAAPNCNRLGIGWSHYDKELRDVAGLWEGPGNAEYVLEMENDFKQDWGKPQLELATYYSRYLSENQQSYDFRPRRGSRFVDTGMIVDSINDGLDYTYPHPVSFPNQNRSFVGAAPDIGPYEYGDSVYWIPGYRYSYPSFPIPRDGANNVPLGGHSIIEDSVIIGGNSAVQQFTRIGRMAMIGGMTGVLKDVIPFALSFGNRNYLKGLNLIGLRRNKYENKEILELGQAYKNIFSSGNLFENVNNVNKENKNNNLIKEVTNFILKDKKRPICSPIDKE
jgi:hypothetical protein